MSQFKILSENKFKAFFQSNAFVEVFFEKKGLARYKYLFGALRIELKSIRHYFVIAYSRLTPLFNPKNPKTFATDSFLTEFERYAKSLGVVDIGYTRLNPGILFYNEKVISKNTIVLSLEMDKDKMNLAPSKATFNMIHETYHNLNMITLKLSNYLRKNGYAAQPSTATLGYGHYPPIAESAGDFWSCQLVERVEPSA